MSTNEDINVLRIGIRLKLCSLVIEYSRTSNKGKKELRHRKIHLEDYIYQHYPELDEDELVQDIVNNVLKKHHKNLVSQIPDNQLSKMVKKLVDHTTTSFIPKSTSNEKQKDQVDDIEEEFEEEFSQGEEEDDNGLGAFQGQNLNKLDDATLNKVKAMMDQKFNALKPGDLGYQYDKQVDFESLPKKKSKWDDDE